MDLRAVRGDVEVSIWSGHCHLYYATLELYMFNFEVLLPPINICSFQSQINLLATQIIRRPGDKN